MNVQKRTNWAWLAIAAVIFVAGAAWSIVSPPGQPALCDNPSPAEQVNCK